MKKWYAVIGDPIAQSMSPHMHDTWFRETGIDASYIPIHVEASKLGEAVASLKRLGCSGWNVTVPHKSAIIPFLDHVDEEARRMNAVNTVKVLEDGTLFGTNTDGRGFVRSLQEIGASMKILVICLSSVQVELLQAFRLHLESAGFGPITFTNRTMEKARRDVRKLSGSSALSLEDAQTEVGKFEFDRPNDFSRNEFCGKWNSARSDWNYRRDNCR